MDFVALTGVNYFLRRRKRWGRLFATAFVSSLAGLLLLLKVRNEWVYRLAAHFLLNTLMTGAAFGIKGKKAFLEDWAAVYGVVIVLGGLIQWMQESRIFAGHFPAQAFCAAALFGVMLIYIMQRKSFGNHIFSAKLKKDVRSISVKAYWDSGNQLRDPYTGQAVAILSRAAAGNFLDGAKDKIRYVPFRSLGAAQGLLRVTNVDELLIYDGKKVISVKQVAVGIAEEGLLEGKDYDLILHASFL